MSAFVVPMEHIRAMVNAGLRMEYGLLHWRAVPLTEQQRKRAYQRGNPGGEGAMNVFQETHHELTPATAQAVGAMLLAENRHSVAYRYNRRELGDEYTHGPSRRRDPLEILKAIACYEYQACETPDWEQSEAAAFCRALRLRTIYELPGYTEAGGWPIETS